MQAVFKQEGLERGDNLAWESKFTIPTENYIRNRINIFSLSVRICQGTTSHSFSYLKQLRIAAVCSLRDVPFGVSLARDGGWLVRSALQSDNVGANKYEHINLVYQYIHPCWCNWIGVCIIWCMVCCIQSSRNFLPGRTLVGDSPKHSICLWLFIIIVCGCGNPQLQFQVVIILFCFHTFFHA